MNSLLGNLQNVIGNSMMQTPPIQIFNSPTVGGQKLNRVSGIDDVNRFQVGPNSEVPLFETDDDVFYVKASDQNGNIVTRRFRFYEESMDGAKYVTNDEFNKFKEEVLNGQQSIQKLIKQQYGSRKHNSGKYSDERPNHSNVETGSTVRESSTATGVYDEVKSASTTNSTSFK